MSIRTGPQLILKIAYEDDLEKTIAFATGLTFTATTGQKMIFGVDSPFPQEIAQAAAPSFIRGSVTLFMPDDSDPVRMGIVAPTMAVPLSGGGSNSSSAGSDNTIPYAAGSKYIQWKLYDRVTGGLVLALQFVKVSNWTIVAQSKSLVQMKIDFEGFYHQIGYA